MGKGNFACNFIQVPDCVELFGRVENIGDGRPYGSDTGNLPELPDVLLRVWQAIGLLTVAEIDLLIPLIEKQAGTV